MSEFANGVSPNESTVTKSRELQARHSLMVVFMRPLRVDSTPDLMTPPSSRPIEGRW